MRSLAMPPNTIAPSRPLPTGSASSHSTAGWRYHRRKSASAAVSVEAAARTRISLRDIETFILSRTSLLATAAILVNSRGTLHHITRLEQQRPIRLLQFQQLKHNRGHHQHDSESEDYKAGFGEGVPPERSSDNQCDSDKANGGHV